MYTHKLQHKRNKKIVLLTFLLAGIVSIMLPSCTEEIVPVFTVNGVGSVNIAEGDFQLFVGNTKNSLLQ